MTDAPTEASKAALKGVAPHEIQTTMKSKPTCTGEEFQRDDSNSMHASSQPEVRERIGGGGAKQSNTSKHGIHEDFCVYFANPTSFSENAKKTHYFLRVKIGPGPHTGPTGHGDDRRGPVRFNYCI